MFQILLVRPTKKILNEKVTVMEGMTTNLTCNASGIPHPNITWWKDHKQIVSNSRIN